MARTYPYSSRSTTALATQSPETRQASAVRIDDFVGSCATTSYATFLVTRYFWDVGAIAIFDPPLDGQASHPVRVAADASQCAATRNVCQIMLPSSPSHNPGRMVRWRGARV